MNKKDILLVGFLLGFTLIPVNAEVVIADNLSVNGSITVSGSIVLEGDGTFSSVGSRIYSPYSFAFGESTVYNESSYSIAFGKSTICDYAFHSFAFGESYIDDYSSHSFAFGESSIDFHAPHSFAVGVSEIGYASPYAIAFGNSSIDAVSYYSAAFGQSQIGSYSAYSTALGRSSIGDESSYTLTAGRSYARGNYSVAFGQSRIGNVGHNFYAFSFGKGFIDDGSEYSVVGGTSHVETSAPFAMALGSYSYAAQPHSVAVGQSLTAESPGTFVIGSLNAPTVGRNTPLDSVFEVGIGEVVSKIPHTETFDFDTYREVTTYELEGVRANAITTLQNGKTTLHNRYWKEDIPMEIPSENVAIGNETSDVSSGGVALEVKGHTVLAGNVTMLQPQGDILMGIFGGAEDSPPETGEFP